MTPGGASEHYKLFFFQDVNIMTCKANVGDFVVMSCSVHRLLYFFLLISDPRGFFCFFFTYSWVFKSINAPEILSFVTESLS